MKTEISIGDILTTASILVSLIALLYSWSKERNLRKKEQADKIRNAAARTLSKLERWQELTGWYFDYVQHIFVEVSDFLSNDYDVLAARDLLWKNLNSSRLLIKQKILDEEIETAYVELYGYIPAIYSLVLETIDALKSAEEKVFNNFVMKTQEDVMAYRQIDKGKYTSAMLGNDLRTTCYTFRTDLYERNNIVMQQVRGFLISVVMASDIDVLDKKISHAISGNKP